MEKNLSPRIRFRGFTEPWKQCPLTDKASLFGGLTYSPNDIQSNGTLVLRSSNVQHGEIVSAKDDVYVNNDVVNVSNVCKGDIIVVVRNGSRALIGKHAAIKHEYPNTVIGAFMSGLRYEHSEFLNALLSTNHFVDEINKNLGATINQITGGNFKEMKFFFPTENEQINIGQVFFSLDETILSKQKELEKLENVKKACMERMFPQEGEIAPQLRFKGFSGVWKSYNLDEIGFMTAGGTPSTMVEEYWNGDINWLQSGAIQNCIIYDSAIEKRITQKGLMNSSTYLIKKDSVLIAITGATCANVGYLTFESCANQSVVSIEPKPDYNSMFLYQILLTRRKDILAMRGGSAQGGVSLGNLKTLNVLIPTLAEQEKIGEYFRHLDELIAAKRQEIEKLKNIKQRSFCLLL